jgi:hypothetical protein
MKDGCLTPEQIVAALQADPSDRRRRHLDECAWCQGLRASLALFDDTEGLPPDADVSAAEARLEAFLERAILRGGEVPEAAGGVSGAAESRGRRKRALPSRGRGWWSDRVWASWAAAAVVILAVGIFLGRGMDRDRPRRLNLRGEEVTQQMIRLGSPILQGDGAVSLSWTPVEDATSYEVELLDGQQAAVAVLAAPQAERVVTVEELALLRGRPSPHFVRIVALHDGDRLARSLPRLLPDAAAGQP